MVPSMPDKPIQPPYEAERTEYGQLVGIRRKEDGAIFRNLEAPELVDFHEWNAKQNPPLDVSPVVFPLGHHWFSSIESLTNFCKAQGVLIYNCAKRGDPGAIAHVGNGTYPGKGNLLQLQIAEPADEIGPLPHVGLIGRKSTLWVTADVFHTLNERLRDDCGDVRRVSSWPIERTFVYLDVSDFSQFPSGHQVLVINSIIRLLGLSNYWQGDSLLELEAKICIGDGYIFVFRHALRATWFATGLALLIDVVRGAIGDVGQIVPAPFHFRIGIHTGPVFCFWDPGRNDWNYAGDGINGGQRVLTAAGKEKDDVVYLSEQVRSAILTETRSGARGSVTLSALQNRGRHQDKHGGMWRIYEIAHMTEHCMAPDKILELIRTGTMPREV
jgi:hypothetical protein